jgi:phosphate transport system ATP-binding protein
MNRLEVENLSLTYAGRTVLDRVSFDVKDNEILAIIGPAQSGKTSLLRCLNRTIELIPSARMTGCVRLDGIDTAGQRDLDALRRRIGMVTPLPVGLPLSIFENVAFAPRCAGISSRAELAYIVEHCLRRAMLWDEVKDRLSLRGTQLSGGQQQRLTLARALSHRPEILCLDEFSIAIDPVTTMRIEDVLRELRSELSIILVTNLTQQARRLADRTMFLLKGEIVELAATDLIFAGHNRDARTAGFIDGRFG